MKLCNFFVFLRISYLFFLSSCAIALQASEVPQWVALFNGKDLSGWVDVNTSPDTWYVKDGLLVCRGKLSAS